MDRLVLATSNLGKLNELKRQLTPLGIEVLAQTELGIPEVDEPHVSFIENALAKARHAARLSRLPALADDSGICVDVLNGAPGVHSARYAGEPRSDQRNNEKMLLEMREHNNRRAHYYCVLVLCRYAEDPEPIIAEGAWQGEILREPRGSGGFGYDPIFFDPRYNKSAAEIPLEQKNELSHRGQALGCLLTRLRRC